MIIRHWRDVDSRVMSALYEREQRSWLNTLAWDASSTWTTIEAARVTWGLPGFVALERGRVRGWTFYLPENGEVHVGGLAADTPRATCLLLDALLDAADAASAQTISCFIFEGAPALTLELTRRGFAVEPFLYLQRQALDAGWRPAAAATASDRWQQGDINRAAALLRTVYGTGAAGRYFAPNGTLAEWQRYLHNLVEQTACGALNADATCVLRGEDGIQALTLVTALADRTAHLAQVAVHPSLQGQGIATRLLNESCARAAAQGYTSATLLVGATNRPARRLYELLGFTTRAAFVAAHRAVARHASVAAIA
jgi:ribosomal protein S18 acetylase RimI-like enzyme